MGEGGGGEQLTCVPGGGEKGVANLHSWGREGGRGGHYCSGSCNEPQRL